MTYEEIRKKYIKTPDNNTSNVTPESSYEALRKKYVTKSHLASGVTVDTNYINAFLSDTKKFSSDVLAASEQVGYKNANSYFEDYKSRNDDLRSRAKNIKAYLYDNRSKLDEDEYNKFIADLDKTIANQQSAVDWFAWKVGDFKQYGSEEEYNKTVQAQKDYEALTSFDLEAGQAEIEGLKSQLKEADSYSNELSSLYRTITKCEAEIPSLPKDHPRRAELQAELDSAKPRFEALMAKYGGEAKKALKATINEKQAYYNQAKYVQDGIALTNNAVNAEDFEEMSKYISTKAEGFWEKLTADDFGYKDTTYEYINNVNGIRDDYKRRHITYSADNPYDDDEFYLSIYDNMTADEIKVYNYYYAKEGKEKAEEYLKSIEKSINSREASRIFSGLKGDTFFELLFGVEAGLDQFASGMENLFNTKDDYIPPSATQMASGMVREDLANSSIPMWYNFKEGQWEDTILGNSLGQITYDATTTTANMIPSILTSAAVSYINPVAGQVVGAGLMGASASGNAYAEMLNLGYDKGQARLYSGLVGASEASLQYLLGGVGKLGGKVSSKVAVGIANNFDNAFARVAIKLGGKALGEFTEEYLQEVLDPVFKNFALGTNENVKLFSKEALYNGILGALSAGILEGGSTVVADVKTTKLGKNVQKIDGGVERLKKLGTTFAADTVAYQIADKVTNETGAYKIGLLLQEVGGTLSEQNVSDIVTELTNKGMDKFTAKRIAKSYQAFLNEEMSLTDEQVEVLEGLDPLADVLRKSIIGRNTSMYQRTREYSDLVQLATEAESNSKSSSISQDDVAKTSKINAPYSDEHYIESVVKEFEAMGMSAEQARAMAKTRSATSADSKSSPVTSNPTDSKFEASMDGETINTKSGEAVEVVGVVASQNGDMMLKVKNGEGKVENVRAKDISFASQEEALIYSVVDDLGTNAAVAESLIKNFDPADGVSAQTYALGIKEAYTYGKAGIPANEMSTKGYVMDLTEPQRLHAYKLGQLAAKTATAKTKEQQQAIKIGKALGYEVEFSSEVLTPTGHKADGRIDNANKKIIINANAKNPGQWVLKHELTHYGEQDVKGYNSFVNAVKKSDVFSQWLQQKTGLKDASVDVMLAELNNTVRADRETAGDAMGPAAAQTEIIADFAGDTLFAENGRGLDELLKGVEQEQKPRIIQFICDFIAYLKNKLSGVKDVSFELHRLEGKYLAMLKTVQKNTTVESGGQYSINSNIIDLSSDNELSRQIGDLRGANKYKIIQNYILTALSEQPITLSDGKKAIVDKSDALHIANKSANKKTAQISKIKELVETAELFAEDNNVDHNKFDYFCYYKADVRYENDVFPLFLNVGKSRNDGTYHIYDITNKIRDTADRINGLERPKPNEGYALTNDVSKYSIPIPPENVKYSVTESDDFSRYDEPITLDDIKILRDIGRKSINQFSADEVEIAQKWAHKFYQQLGTKSPFFRRWFGDWRAFDKNIVNFKSNIKRLLIQTPEQAAEYFKNGLKNKTLFRGDVKNNDTGFMINVGTQVYNDTLTYSNRAFSRRNDINEYQIRLSVLNNIKDIVSSSVLLDTEIANADKKTTNMYQSFFHKFYTLVKIEGKQHLVKLTVDELNSDNTIRRAYNVNDIKISPVAVSQVYKPAGTTDDNGDLLSTISISDLFNLVKTYDPEFKPNPVSEVLLNEDGTPKVFYHGTSAEFNAFSFDELSSREGSFFFAENREDAAGYGNNVFEVYLTGEKLADYDNQPSEFYQLRNKREQVEYLKKLGYDGWYSDMDGDGWGEVSVFSPTQIKSAKDGGNIGTFSEAKSDIRYSISENNKQNVDYTAEFDKLSEQFERGDITRADFVERVKALYNAAGEEYGTIPKGETVTGDENYDDPTPKSVDGKKNVRRHVRTIIEGGSLTEEMLDITRQQVLSGDLSYTPTSNEGNLKYAKRAIESGRAESMWQMAANSEEKPSANAVAVGEMLLKLAVEKRDVAKVVQLTAELSEMATRLGQATQAFSMLKRMDGIGQLYYVQKTVDRLNQDMQKKYKSKAPVITINEALALQLAESKSKEDFEITYGAIMNDVASQVPSTFLDKWNAWRYMAMLCNPTTHVRNIVGNAIFCPVVKAKDTAAALAEKAVIKDKSKRTKSVVIKKEYKDFAKNDFDEIADIITSGGKMNPQQSIADNKRIFNNRVLESFRKLNFGALENEDIFFLRAHYARALGGFLQARNIDIKNISQNVLAYAREYAMQEAKKATYRDASALANAVSSFSKKNALANVMVEGVLPFKKTPINIIKRGIEYSPLGLIYTLSKGTYDLKKGNITASQWIDGMAGGLTGTAIVALGMFFSSLGYVKGGFGDEEEDWFNKMLGMQEYSVEIGGYSYTVDWAAPACMPFFMGVALAESLEKDGNLNTFSSVVNALGAGLEPFINLSMLSGVQDTIAAARYAENDEIIESVATNIIESYFSQALPTIGGKINNIIDPIRRSNYIDKTSPVPEFVQSALNTIYSKIPGLSSNKAEYINAWGETETKGGMLERLFQNIVSPGYLSRVDVTDVDEEIKKIADETGDDGVFPETAEKYIKFKGFTKHLSPEEYTDYATGKGQMSAEYIEELIEHSEYENLSAEQKAEVIKNLYGLADAKAKANVKYTSDEVIVMSGGIVDEEKYKSYTKAQRQTIVDNCFLGGQYKTAVSFEEHGESVVDYYVKSVADESDESSRGFSDVRMAFELDDTELAFEMIEEAVKVKTENYISKGETEKDAEKKAKSSVKSSMTSYWKPLYIEACKSNDNEEMKRIRNILLKSNLYGNSNDVTKTGQDWIKSAKK